MRQKVFYVFLYMSMVFCSSCTTIKVVPENIVKPANRELTLQCKLIFDGNRTYLPGTLVDSQETDICVNYDYKVFYDSTSAERELLQSYIFMSPYTFLGLPTGGDDVLAVAKLIIKKKEQYLKTYFAQAKVTKARSIFAGASDKTELRRLALMAIKENLENQMLNDYEMLSTLNKEKKK